jgi:hypothetical protein
MAFLDRLKRPKPASQPAPPTKPRGASGRIHTDGFIVPDEINQALVGERGLQIFDEMFRTDADCRRALTMAGVPLASGTWEVRPYGDDNDPTTPEDEEVAAFVNWNLTEHMTPNLPAHIWELWRVAGRSGFAPFEQIYETTQWHGRTVLALKTLDLRLPKTILRWVQDGPDLVMLEQLLMVGGTVELPMRDLVYYRLGAEGDNWEGESLLRPAYKHWKYKSAIELVQAIGIEKTSVGVPTGYPPRAAAQEDLDAFEEFLSTIRVNEASFFMAPGPRADHDSTQNGTQGWFWEFVVPGTDKAASAAVKDALDYHSSKIDAVVLGEFMRLGQQGVGARATADVQQDPFLAYVEALASMVIESPINTQLIPRLVGLNYSTARMPKLVCSLIDSTSLTELADYVSKLASAGALRPEPTLEAYLRAKADFPEADEAAIKSQQEDAMRQAQDIAGAAAAAKGADDGTLPGDKPPAKDQPPTKLDSGPVMLARQDRPLRPWEQTMSLDRIEQSINDAQARMEQAAGDQARQLAVSMARGQKATTTDLEVAVEQVLDGLFLTGRATVVEELQRQRLGDLSWMLDAGGPDEVPAGERKTLRARARAVADTIRAQIAAALAAVQFQRGASDATVQASAEAAAMGALRGQAQVHASSVLNAGRTVQAGVQEAEIQGSRYTSILDGRRCAACARADDDVLRPLDDPVRLARVPPNPDCEGGGRCRCMEAFQLVDEAAGDA